MDMLLTSTYQGLLWSLMAMGVYLTFRILDIADMTAEGSFPLGGAITGILLMKEVSPVLATILSLLGGMLAGGVAGLLHTKLKIPALLTGILTMTGLYSVNLLVMGKANISFLAETKTLFQMTTFSEVTNILLIGTIVVLVVIALLVFFFNTEMGLAARAVGNNEQMAEANGVSKEHMKIIVYMISNGLIALSGSLMTQMNGFADISMGIGTIVIALAAIIVAEILFHHLTFGQRLLTIVLGSVIYRFLIAGVLELGVDVTYLRALYSLFLVLFLGSLFYS